MRIAIRGRIKRLKFSLVVGTITSVKGVNSALADGNHIIMWEFDETDYETVWHWLWAAQAFHSLPHIYVSRSHPGGGYHAYCFTRVSWVKSIEIVASTQGVDPGYISMCAMRGHWTLRLTDKGQGQPEHLGILHSDHPQNVEAAELLSYVDYEVWTKSMSITIGKRGL